MFFLKVPFDLFRLALRAAQVSAAVWGNYFMVNGRQATMLKATVGRRYKDKDGNWQSSGSFGRNEIPLSIYVPGKCFGAIVEKESSQSAVQEEEEVVVVVVVVVVEQGEAGDAHKTTAAAARRWG